MGGEFGNLYKLRGIITYKISPYEQRAFAGAITKGLPNIVRRISERAIMIGGFGTAWYVLYTQIEKYHGTLMRKNPADFENDV